MTRLKRAQKMDAPNPDINVKVGISSKQHKTYLLGYQKTLFYNLFKILDQPMEYQWNGLHCFVIDITS